jgi:hypothetical protein
MRTHKIIRNKLNSVRRKLKFPVDAAVLSRVLNEEFKAMKVRFRITCGWYYSVEGYYNAYRESTDEPIYAIDVSFDLFECDDHIIEGKFLNNDKFFDEIYYTLVHEFRHGYQNRRRNHKYLKPSKRYYNPLATGTFHYYSFYDELDAYAYEAADAIVVTPKSFMKALKSNWIVRRYRQICKKDAPKVYNKLLKKIYVNVINNSSHK